MDDDLLETQKEMAVPLILGPPRFDKIVRQALEHVPLHPDRTNLMLGSVFVMGVPSHIHHLTPGLAENRVFEVFSETLLDEPEEVQVRTTLKAAALFLVNAKHPLECTARIKCHDETGAQDYRLLSASVRDYRGALADSAVEANLGEVKADRLVESWLQAGKEKQ